MRLFLLVCQSCDLSMRVFIDSIWWCITAILGCRSVWKTKLYSATRQYHFKSQNVRVPLPHFHMDCVHRWAINGLFRTNCESRPFLSVHSRKEHSTEQWRPTYNGNQAMTLPALVGPSPTRAGSCHSRVPHRPNWDLTWIHFVILFTIFFFQPI